MRFINQNVLRENCTKRFKTTYEVAPSLQLFAKTLKSFYFVLMCNILFSNSFKFSSKQICDGFFETCTRIIYSK